MTKKYSQLQRRAYLSDAWIFDGEVIDASKQGHDGTLFALLENKENKTPEEISLLSQGYKWLARGGLVDMEGIRIASDQVQVDQLTPKKFAHITDFFKAKGYKTIGIQVNANKTYYFGTPVRGLEFMDLKDLREYRSYSGKKK